MSYIKHLCPRKCAIYPAHLNLFVHDKLQLKYNITTIRIFHPEPFSALRQLALWCSGGATENAGVENGGIDLRGGKCRSRLAVWKVEPRLYSETALNYFLKIVLRLLTE